MLASKSTCVKNIFHFTMNNFPPEHKCYQISNDNCQIILFYYITHFASIIVTSNRRKPAILGVGNVDYIDLIVKEALLSSIQKG